MKECDIGIIYPSIPPTKLFDGYIKFSGISNRNDFIFREEINSVESNIIHVNGNDITLCPSPEKNVIDLFESIYNGNCYYLCNNPPRVSVYNGKQFMYDILLDIPNCNPLFITETDDEIIVTVVPAMLVLIPKQATLSISYIDLQLINSIEPQYVQKIDNKYLITDSSNHTVRLVDRFLKIYWEYGISNHPGTLENQLCVPVNAIYYNKSIYISEQRSHRVIVVSFPSKKIIRQYGIVNQIGCSSSYLWAPQIAIKEQNLYIIMCKACNIFIKKINQKHELEDYYGTPVMVSSILNFPRACDYSQQNGLLAVCDTYHDRICLFDAEGNRIHCKCIDSLQLSWPRCVKWVNENLLIANSNKREVIYTTGTDTIRWTFLIEENLAPNEWIQAVDLIENYLLVAFETYIVVYDTTNQKQIWTSSSMNEKFQDIHHAEFAFGGILVSDTGHNRLILIKENQIVITQKLLYQGNMISLKKPRMAKITQNHSYIVNSGTSQIYVCDHDMTHILFIYGGNRGLDQHRFSIPRWLCSGPEGMFFISDTDNHRIALRNFSKFDSN